MDLADLPARLRLFFALWPSAEARSALTSWQGELRERCGGRAMEADSLHLTLLFLGDVPRERLPEAIGMARDLRLPPFRVQLDRAHHWPHNHIVYAAPDDPPSELTGLAEALQQRAISRHFSVERRPYHPHVTLLRNADVPVTALPRFDATGWMANGFSLLISRHRPDQPRYRSLADYALTG